MIQDWRSVQRSGFFHVKELAEFLEWGEDLKKQVVIKPSFPLNLPRRLAEKIPKNTLEDPILRQFVPLLEETVPVPGFVKDPVEEESFRKKPKLLHKYEGRALLVCTSACAMNCRFCFRRNFEYETESKGFEEELKAIAEEPSLQEIILSGGDPLSLSDTELFALMDGLAAIPHLRRLRFHTRFPIGIPERISKALIEKFSAYPLQIVFVIHTNHPTELDRDVFDALDKLQRIKIPVLSQTVLLKGVNDDNQVLQTLFESLVNKGIMPYYLHQLDKVAGAAHFEVLQEKGLSLMKALESKLSGYAFPRYVQEIAGRKSKTQLFGP